MVAHVVEEFQVLRDYRVMILDRDIRTEEQTRCRIDGQSYTPIRLGGTTVPIPLNYIAVKARRSFKGSSVEVV